MNGDTFHGTSVCGRGVFTSGEHNYSDMGQHRMATYTYAGQHKDGYACGLGMTTDDDSEYPDGDTQYAEYGPDGRFDGRWLSRWGFEGDTGYGLYERGEAKDHTFVYGNGCCYYNSVDCAPDDPRMLALIAQVAPVEVRPAAPAPHPPSPFICPQAIVRWISRLVLPQ